MRVAGSYQYPTMESVIYGKPAAEALREEAERLDARRVYLIVSRTLNTTTEEIEKIRKALGDRHAETFDGIPQHTTREVVVRVAKQAKDAKADLVVAIGGGSVVDAAKIVLMCMEHEIFEQDGLDGFETTPERRIGPFRTPKVRMVAVPSTLSGGEYNSGTLVTDTRRKLKQIFSHPMMMPRSIILDSSITKYTPEKLWLGSGTRAMDHGIEAICSVRPNALVDAVCLQGLRYLYAGLRRTRSNPDDQEARLNCQLGSWLSAFGLQARVPMGASHAIGHVLGGTCEVPHYFCTAVMMPSVLRYNRSVHGSRSEVDRSGTRRTGPRCQRSLCGLYRGAWAAETTRRGWRWRGPLRIDRQERNAVNFHSREPATDPRAWRRRQDTPARGLKTRVSQVEADFASLAQ